MAEFWDIYDIDGNKTGRLHERGKPMRAGDCHLVVHIWIINSKGEFLITKRACDPIDMWQTTGGCAVAGDDGLTAALRETKEEVGIELNPVKGLLFKHYSDPHLHDKGTYIVDVWVFRMEVDIDAVVYQPGETCDAIWANVETIRRMISDGAFLVNWYSYLDELFSGASLDYIIEDWDYPGDRPQYMQWADGVPYRLDAPFDLSLIAKYGKVLKVYDGRGAGNICFGVEMRGRKYFVKFAGAPIPNYIANRESGAIDAASAIALLKAATSLYTELAHPNLIKIISAEEIGGGYAIVFEWESAIGIEPINSPDYMRFMRLPIEKKLRAFEDIMEFHAHVAAKGYVALDFYDGNILYDYDNDKVIICDIDLYQKSPFQNIDNLGAVGSARYVSPEECVNDDIIDEISNVYTMGAAAFALLACGDRSKNAWLKSLSPALYAVAAKAVSDERNKRQQSIRQLIAEWKAAAHD